MQLSARGRYRHQSLKVQQTAIPKQTFRRNASRKTATVARPPRIRSCKWSASGRAGDRDGEELPVQFPELADKHLTVGKDGSNLEMSAERFDILDQRTDANVGSVLNLGNLALMHPKNIAKL